MSDSSESTAVAAAPRAVATPAVATPAVAGPTLADAVAAHRALSALSAPQPKGVPAPPFGATLRVASAIRTLAPLVVAYQTQIGKIQGENAMIDPATGEPKIVTDNNGNVQSGAFYVGNGPKVNAAVAELDAKPADVTVSGLTLGDVVDVGGRLIDPAMLAALIPFLSGTLELDAAATARLAAHDAALARLSPPLPLDAPALPAAVPATAPGA